MTEDEWLASASPELMLEAVKESASERKLLLFACACWRRLWHLIPSGAAREPVEMAEAFADGLIARAEWEGGHQHWRETVGGLAVQLSLGARVSEALGYLGMGSFLGPQQARLALQAGRAAAEWAGAWAVAAEAKAQCEFLRDIFGNPLRPPTWEPHWARWNDGCAVRLAREIYDDRHFEDLPVLADALEDAGCDSEEILGHLRGGQHVRGCWVLDHLLGR